MAELILSALWSVCSVEFNRRCVFPNFLIKITPIQQTTPVTLMGKREHGAGKSIRLAQRVLLLGRLGKQTQCFPVFQKMVELLLRDSELVLVFLSKLRPCRGI